jgi:hypothetical protein
MHMKIHAPCSHPKDGGNMYFWTLAIPTTFTVCRDPGADSVWTANYCDSLKYLHFHVHI